MDTNTTKLTVLLVYIALRKVVLGFHWVFYWCHHHHHCFYHIIIIIKILPTFKWHYPFYESLVHIFHHILVHIFTPLSLTKLLFSPTMKFDILWLPPLNCVCVGFFEQDCCPVHMCFPVRIHTSWLINMPLGSHKAILCILYTCWQDVHPSFSVSNCSMFWTVWRTIFSSVESFLFGFSVIWIPFLAYHTLLLTLAFQACA